MTYSEQQRLYKHFLNLSTNGKDAIQKANCKGYADALLKIYPEFKPKEPVKEELEPIIKPKVVKPKLKGRTLELKKGEETK